MAMAGQEQEDAADAPLDAERVPLRRRGPRFFSTATAR
jgi:hypothetical protein